MQRHFPAFASLTASCFLQAAQGNISAAGQNLLLTLCLMSRLHLRNFPTKRALDVLFHLPLCFRIPDGHISDDGD